MIRIKCLCPVWGRWEAFPFVYSAGHSLSTAVPGWLGELQVSALTVSCPMRAWAAGLSEITGGKLNPRLQVLFWGCSSRCPLCHTHQTCAHLPVMDCTLSQLQHRLLSGLPASPVVLLGFFCPSCGFSNTSANKQLQTQHGRRRRVVASD